MKCNIYVNKIASEVPLSFWNKTVVADSLSLCFRYQEDEYAAYNNTMHVKTINHWIPENTFTLEATYKEKKYIVAKKTIGFYSSGMWLRKKLGRIDLEDNAHQNEKDLFSFLLGFCTEFPEYKLVVFLHPLEKNYMEETTAHYALHSKNIILGDLNTPNTLQFFNADVGVTLYSTLSYERLFWGFKTLIHPLGHPDFPLKSSSFSNISSRNEQELKNNLLEALKSTPEEFFESNKISTYTYRNYKAFHN